MNYLKHFFDKARAIMLLIDKESKRNNKFAQKTAKDLQEFHDFAEALYLENIQLKAMLKEKNAIIQSQLVDMREDGIMKERDLLRDVYRRYANNSEVRKIVKELANLNVESLKYLKNEG